MIQVQHNHFADARQLAAMVAAVLLVGCATPQQRMDAAIAKAQAICSAAGISSADPRYQDCTLQMYQADQQRRGAATAQLAAQLMNAAQLLTPQPAPPPPQPTMCSTYVNGQYINTRCW